MRCLLAGGKANVAVAAAALLLPAAADIAALTTADCTCVRNAAEAAVA